jgi:hypothetical protein
MTRVNTQQIHSNRLICRITTDQRSALQQSQRLLDGGYLAYYPKVSQLLGCVTSAVMLNQMLYWTRKLSEHSPNRQGWFWKTQTEWYREIGLSRRNQETARKHLLKLGILEEKRIGVPARLHYRVNLDVLGHLLCERTNLTYEQWDWKDSEWLRKILGQTCGIFKHFIFYFDSIPVAVYLSTLFNWAKMDAIRGELRWYQRTPSFIIHQHGLTRSQLDLARSKLKGMGILREALSHTAPMRLLSQIDPEQFLSVLAQKSKNNSELYLDSTRIHQQQQFNIPSKPTKPNADKFVKQERQKRQSELTKMSDATKTSVCIVGNVQTETCETYKLQPTKRTNWNVGNVQTGMAETRNAFISIETTTEGITKTPPLHTATSTQAVAGHPTPGVVVVYELDFHQSIPANEHGVIKKMLSHAVDQNTAQLIIHELAGQLINPNRRQQIYSRLAYIRGILQKIKSGEPFIPEYAHRISEQIEKMKIRTQAPEAGTSITMQKTVPAISAEAKAKNSASLMTLKKALLSQQPMFQN